ncbi:MAG: hydrogenase nickel incorporation protein HypB [Verrucomicrobiota bacterium]
MCKDCGCGNVGDDVTIGGQPASGQASPHSHSHDHPHDHGHEHGHEHGHGHSHGPQTIELNRSILEKNDRLAERNRGFFKAKGLLVLNVVSSPGSGKTTLVQRTAELLGRQMRTGVVVGDLATDNDAARLKAAGVPVVQITTGTVCHLEADMVAKAADKLKLDELDLLIVENVGNLVCPASYDLGEDLRVVLLSVTEGEDKPLKYPPMFHSADVVLVTKTDLAQPCGFDRNLAMLNLGRISHHAKVFEVSAKTGEWMDAWCDFLRQRKPKAS